MAQPPDKVSRLGYITGTGASPNETFIRELRDLGYTEAKNITIEFRTAKGQIADLPRLAGSVVSASVDVILAADFNSAVAAKSATHHVPVVFQTLGDPVASGLVTSLARPGGNLTGVAGFGPELSGKRLEIIKDVIGEVVDVAFLTDPANVASTATLRETQVAAKSLNMKLHVYKAATPAELKNAFVLMRKNQVDALLVNHDPTLTAQRDYILRLVQESRLPAIYIESQWAPSGGLISYGPSLSNQFRRAAVYVDKILKGAKPADLPVEQPSSFELVVNLKAAKQINLKIPPHVLARADKVIR